MHRPFCSIPNFEPFAFKSCLFIYLNILRPTQHFNSRQMPQFRDSLTSHFYIGTIICFAGPFIFSQSLFTTACLIGTHFIVLMMCYPANEPMRLLFFVTLPHIFEWIVLAGVELILRQFIFW